MADRGTTSRLSAADRTERSILDDFDPDRVAYFEANGWRAYYDRRWVHLLRLIVQLCQEQFRIPFPRSLQAAYYVTRAAKAWVPIDHDNTKVLAYYERFYRLARRYSGLRFEPARVAELELNYNEVHRRLVDQPDKTEFIKVMTELHAELFQLTLEQAADSARWRVEAANVVDRITGGTSTDIEADWQRVEECLRACYRSVKRELAASHPPAEAITAIETK